MKLFNKLRDKLHASSSSDEDDPVRKQEKKDRKKNVLLGAGVGALAGAAGAGGFKQSLPIYKTIPDNYSSLQEVQEELRKSGLESSNLVIAVDFTKSNEWTGKSSFGGKSLHAITTQPNPYEHAIQCISNTLSAFDVDQRIPAYGFGDGSTEDRNVMSFLPNDVPLHGLGHLSWRYRELVPHVKLAGPTTFAPAIWQAIRIVKDSGYKYHILVIVADGQVTGTEDPNRWRQSRWEQDTLEALVAASHFPLSIVVVGVGDGPFAAMKEADDKQHKQLFDNMQFVNYTELMHRQSLTPNREASFAVHALMEVPVQYQLIKQLGLLGRAPDNKKVLDELSRRPLPVDPPASSLTHHPLAPPGVAPAQGGWTPGAVPPGGAPGAYPQPGPYPPPGAYPPPEAFAPPGQAGATCPPYPAAGQQPGAYPAPGAFAPPGQAGATYTPYPAVGQPGAYPPPGACPPATAHPPPGQPGAFPPPVQQGSAYPPLP